MQIHQSAEDYLEAILVLHRQKGAVRSIDIAVYKSYSKPSISRAVSLLRGKRLYPGRPGRIHHPDCIRSGNRGKRSMNDMRSSVPG